MAQTQSLKETIQDAMKQSMKAKDSARVRTIRLMLAPILQAEIDSQTILSDSQVLDMLNKMLKQRRQSIELYKTAQRTDLAEQEEYEMTVIQTFLPTPLTEAEIDTLLDDAINQTQANSMRDMGAVMNRLKESIQGRADMSAVSKKLKAKLG